MINNPKIEYLKDKAAHLPATPGVYLMKNEAGEIIYVGKSKKLKNRVSSYFIDTYHTPKTQKMVSLVRDFDNILCDTEIEALTLENILIKKHMPKYNICLKDSKSYPYIKITAGKYPKIIMTRERKNDGGTYLGPYSGTSVAGAAIDAVQRAFLLPMCRREFPRDIGRERPCLYRQMGRCIAPCTGEISEEEYKKRIAGAREVLGGNIKETVARLTKEMNLAAEDLRFEEAGRLRDTVAALGALKDKQKIIIDTDSNKDIWAWYQSDIATVLTVISVRDGALNAKNDFVFSSQGLFDGEAITSFLFGYYGENPPPNEILLSQELDDECFDSLGESLKALGKTELRTPKRGAVKKLCDMALDNAKEKARKIEHESEKNEKSAVNLAKLLALEVVPERIEAYDISNLGSEFITAGMIVSENGVFKHSDYRTFRIKTVEGTDDYMSMKEALTRRLAHIGDGSASLGVRPDLILIDGGKGHVNTVKEVMKNIGVEIPVFGMVKDDFHKTRAMTDGENEIGIARDNSVFVMIYKIQDEVHRYTVGSMSEAKRKTLRRSELENIVGFGPAKAKKLLKKYGSLAKIEAMSEEDLIKDGVNEKDAKNIRIYFEEEERRKEEKRK